MTINGSTFFCSWSGGKDSCLALYHAIKEGGKPKKLLTMLTEEGERSRSHGLSLKLLKRQAQSLNIPFITGSATWKDYEERFISIITELKQDGIDVGVFGDIDLEDHREWEQMVCDKAQVIAYLPLWQRARKDLVKEFVNLGFKATIISLKDGVLGREYLGRELSLELIDELEAKGVDPAGEGGEFHTVVTDGPIFSSAINIELKEQVYSNGYWFQDIIVV